jgi:EAL domain-containing protein (putative c-di-GMP-specific phosphodiesterase class I)
VVEAGGVDLWSERPDGARWLARRAVGDVIGEAALTGAGAVRTATAVAVQPTILRVCDRARLLRSVDLVDSDVRACLLAALGLLEGLEGPRQQASPRIDPVPRRFEQDFEAALAQGELDLYLQPVVRLPDGALLGFEALARWVRGPHGPITPATFLPVAETTGLVVPMTRWVFAAACRLTHDLDHIPIVGDEPPFVSVNLSARDVVDSRLPDRLRHMLEETGADPRRLRLEVTEAMLETDPALAGDVLAGCRDLGLKVVLDDFGDGAASLACLHRFAFDGIKIDGALVRRLDDAGGGGFLVRSLLTVAASLALPVVAEGVETEAEAFRLAELGCPQGQGFLFARPVLAEEALNALRAR